ncbi:hypothetical protein KIPB_010261, partial [Kipferlia bialata]
QMLSEGVSGYNGTDKGDRAMRLELDLRAKDNMLEALKAKYRESESRAISAVSQNESLSARLTAMSESNQSLSQTSAELEASQKRVQQLRVENDRLSRDLENARNERSQRTDAVIEDLTAALGDRQAVTGGQADEIVKLREDLAASLLRVQEIEEGAASVSEGEAGVRQTLERSVARLQAEVERLTAQNTELQTASTQLNRSSRMSLAHMYEDMRVKSQEEDGQRMSALAVLQAQLKGMRERCRTVEDERDTLRARLRAGAGRGHAHEADAGPMRQMAAAFSSLGQEVLRLRAELDKGREADRPKVRESDSALEREDSGARVVYPSGIRFSDAGPRREREREREREQGRRVKRGDKDSSRVSYRTRPSKVSGAVSRMTLASSSHASSSAEPALSIRESIYGVPRARKPMPRKTIRK